MLYAEDGKTSAESQRQFHLTSGAGLKVIDNGRNASLRDISQGDIVFLKVTDGYVTEISFSGAEKSKPVQNAEKDVGRAVSKIYKARLNSYDELDAGILVSDVLQLDGERWGYTQYKGIIQFAADPHMQIFYDNRALFMHEINIYKGKEIYLAIGPGINDKEEVLFATINPNETEETYIYDGEIKTADRAAQRVSLQRFFYDFNVGNGTIVVKNGKLAAVDELSKGDYAYLAAAGTGRGYNAFVVNVDKNAGLQSGELEIYHASVLSVDVSDKTIVVSTYRYYDIKSRRWLVSSHKLKLRITSDTRVYDENGLVNNRELTAFSEIGRGGIWANILVDGDALYAMSIDDLPQGVIRGKVGSVGAEGSAANLVNLYNVQRYEIMDEGWWEEESGPLEVQPNTIIIKNNVLVPAEYIKIGDSVTVIYKESYERAALIMWIN